MQKILKKYDSLLHVIGIAELGLGIICLFAIVLFIFSQVVSRYVFNKPLVWVEELSTYCFIWAVYLGTAYALIKGRHIRVTTLIDMFPRIVQEVLAIFTYVCLMFFLIVLVRNGIKQVIFEGPQHTIALPVRLPRKYFYSIPFVVSCVSMLFTSIYLFLNQVYELFTRSPHQRMAQ